jgi:hypothetical protein
MMTASSGAIYQVVAELPTGEKRVITQAAAADSNAAQALQDCVAYANGAADGWKLAMQTIGTANVFIDVRQ